MGTGCLSVVGEGRTTQAGGMEPRTHRPGKAETDVGRALGWIGRYGAEGTSDPAVALMRNRLRKETVVGPGQASAEFPPTRTRSDDRRGTCRR